MTCLLEGLMFKDWFKKALAEGGVTKYRVHKITGISNPHLSRLGTGENVPSPEYALSIAEALADERGLQDDERRAFINEALIAAGHAPLPSNGDSPEHTPAVVEQLRELNRTVEDTLRGLTGNQGEGYTQNEPMFAFYAALSQIGNLVDMTQTPVVNEDGEPTGQTLQDAMGHDTACIRVTTDTLLPVYPQNTILFITHTTQPLYGKENARKRYIVRVGDRFLLRTIRAIDNESATYTFDSETRPMAEVEFVGVIKGRYVED